MENIKIYYNGFRIGSSKELVKASFSYNKSTDSVYMYEGRWSNGLPRGYGFGIRNDSDPYTDYFDYDCATVTAEHPLFKYLKYAALKSDYMFAKRQVKKGPGCYNYDKYVQTVNEFEQVEDPGQPTQEDLEAIATMLEEKSAAEKKAEEDRIEACEAEAMIEAVETEIIIDRWESEFPVEDGKAVVKVPFSERRGIKNGSVWSLAAANKIFEELDAIELSKNRGYDKTDFTIEFGRAGDDDYFRYSGRYNIGDGEGTLVNHVRNFAEYLNGKAFDDGKLDDPYAMEAARSYHRITELAAMWEA